MEGGSQAQEIDPVATGSQENEETSDPITEQGFYEDDLVKTDIITMEENRQE